MRASTAAAVAAALLASLVLSWKASILQQQQQQYPAGVADGVLQFEAARSHQSREGCATAGGVWAGGAGGWSSPTDMERFLLSYDAILTTFSQDYPTEAEGLQAGGAGHPAVAAAVRRFFQDNPDAALLAATDLFERLLQRAPLTEEERAGVAGVLRAEGVGAAWRAVSRSPLLDAAFQQAAAAVHVRPPPPAGTCRCLPPRQVSGNGDCDPPAPPRLPVFLGTLVLSFPVFFVAFLAAFGSWVCGSQEGQEEEEEEEGAAVVEAPACKQVEY